MDLNFDKQDREHEYKLGREVRDLDLELERIFAAIFVIGECEFRFVNDGELLLLDLDR